MMKVTVCFGSTKVVVPCGSGDLLVRELILKATTRYKKATSKGATDWVNVISLKSLSDGGILDGDDQLKDVADDREQLVALYEEHDTGLSGHIHVGGDGTSASSVGTSSPDIFRGAEYANKKEYRRLLNGTNNDVVITHKDLNSSQKGSNLVVRHGSEPNLNKLTVEGNGLSVKPGVPRWSVMDVLDGIKTIGQDSECGSPPPTVERAAGTGQDNSPSSSFSTFSRGSSRRSLANNAAMIKWLEAQEKTQQHYEDEYGRREPVGGRAEDESKPTGKQGQLITLLNAPGSLGIHVIPEFDQSNRARGLLIQSVEDGGRIHADGRIFPGDVIIDINDITLNGLDFSKAQEVFRQALHAKELCLNIIKAPPPLPNEPPPVHRSLSPIGVPSSPGGQTPSPSGGAPSPTRGVPPPVPVRNAATSLTTARIVATNTRKLGQKIQIQLTKGADGLGFSVTTRDNPTGGHAPIYIKNILPKGAAIQNGNLYSGDRLLEVNGVEMTGKSQTNVVALLRSTKMGGVVNLVVSRQVIDGATATTTTPQKPDEQNVTVSMPRETLSIDIAMDSSSSTGLGLNVKGKTVTTEDGLKDIGIFIKAVIAGSAAAKDGRIQVNDRLLVINDDSLEGKSNPQAMEILRSAVKKDTTGLQPIRIIITRKSSAMNTSRPSSTHEVRISQSDNHIDMPPVNYQEDNKPKLSLLANPLLAKVKREQSLRNSSYQMANHDSLVNETIDSVFTTDGQPAKSQERQETVRMRSLSSGSENRVRPASTLGFVTNGSSNKPQLSLSKSNQDLLDGDTWLTEWEKSEDTTLNNDTNRTDSDAITAFSREGFGRQSMSEKRKGHVDPRMIDFYQKLKLGKESSEFMEGFRRRDDEVSLRKSTSLDSIQMSNQGDSDHGDGAVQRRRACNESFHAAVDHSYEHTEGVREILEEKSESGGSASQDGKSQEDKPDKKNKKEKEKSIFKGLFKKSKKTDRKTKSTEELYAEHHDRLADDRQQLFEKRQLAFEKQRAAEQREKQREEEPTPKHPPQATHGESHVVQATHGDSRTDKIQQLRLEHQRRHRERHGQYLLDAEEERKIQELEQRKASISSENSHHANYPMKYERAHPVYVDGGDPYNHYQNITEIQAQLKKHDYYQHRYHHHVDNYPPSSLYSRETPIPPGYVPHERIYTPRDPAFTPRDPSRAPPRDPAFTPRDGAYTPIEPAFTPRDHTRNPARELAFTPRDPAHNPRDPAFTPRDPARNPRDPAFTPRDPPPHSARDAAYTPREHYHHPAYYTPHHPGYRSITPTPHSHATPGNHGTYISHSAMSKTTPQILNPATQDYHRQRAYSEFDTKPYMVYRDPPYGSLPRRRQHREVASSAQV